MARHNEELHRRPETTNTNEIIIKKDRERVGQGHQHNLYSTIDVAI